MTRKPNSLVRPESAIVEMGNFRQGVEASAMGVAGEIAELLEFAKYGEIGFCAEGALQLGQIGDLVAAKVLAKHRGVERGGACARTVLCVVGSEVARQVSRRWSPSATQKVMQISRTKCARIWPYSNPGS